MKRKILFTVLTTMAAIACDSGGATTTVGAAPNAMLGIETDGDAEVTAGDSSQTSVDEPNEPFSAEWTDSAEAAGASSLSFEVTNETDEERSVTVALVAESALGVARKPFGEVAIAAGESAAFSVSASDLPIRSAEVVSQVFVELTRVNIAGLGPFEVTTRTACRWFLHDAGYGAVRAYTQESFIAERGGVYASLSVGANELSASALEAKVLGEIADAYGVYSVVTAAGSELVSHDETEGIEGVVTWAADGRGDVSGSADAIVVPDEGGDTELEVDDE
ncbi:MAG: hypothetical protein M0R80_09655 [Proteobacteria bacterium]|jgi:hypothetical protein|nr:hypothetical protein [Pseudomonadota bacterium]